MVDDEQSLSDQALENYVLPAVFGRIKEAEKRNAEFYELPQQWASFSADITAHTGWKLEITKINNQGAVDPNGDKQIYRFINPHHEE